jgi:putative tricarboxylic transport membrane protein
MLDPLFLALHRFTSLEAVGFIFLGTLIGLVFGILPGLGGVSALAILVPFTFGMDQMDAMFFYISILGAVPFGGSISAILLNTPGTPENAATTFDGHPMARRGEARKALGISATASGLGTLVGMAVLILLLPVVRRVALLFGPPEVFVLVLFGLVTVAFAAGRNLLKGLISGGIGVLISFIGFSPVFGTLRFGYGSEYLWDGVQLVPFLIGMFAISELINYSMRGGTIARESVKMGGSTWEGVKEVFKHWGCFLRSSAIGTLIGIVPGVGATVSNFMAYVTAKESSKHPETFGTGDPEGIVAAESANNSTIGGALVPTVSFGIPGSASMTVLLGGLILHGLPVGPLLVRDHVEIIFALLIGLFFSNLIASSFGLMAAGYLARITFIRVVYIIPTVAVFCFVGAFALRENLWDVALAFAAGIFGYGIGKFGFSKVCLVIGFILGILAEESFRQSLMISYGSFAIFTSPICLVLFGFVALMLAYSVLKTLKYK